MAVLKINDSSGIVTEIELNETMKDKSILEIAEENKVNISYSCRNGFCFACAGKIVKGKMNILKDGIKDVLIDVPEDNLLTCTSCIKNLNEDVSIELLS